MSSSEYEIAYNRHLEGDINISTTSFSESLNPQFTNPSWSPDGKWIAFVSD